MITGFRPQYFPVPIYLQMLYIALSLTSFSCLPYKVAFFQQFDHIIDFSEGSCGPGSPPPGSFRSPGQAVTIAFAPVSLRFLDLSVAVHRAFRIAFLHAASGSAAPGIFSRPSPFHGD